MTIDWTEYKNFLVNYYGSVLKDIDCLSKSQLLEKGISAKFKPRYRRLIANIDFRLEMLNQYIVNNDFILFLTEQKENVHFKAVPYIESADFAEVLDSSGVDILNEKDQIVFRLDNLIDLDIKYSNIKNYAEMIDAIENKVRLYVGESIRSSKKRKIIIFENIFKQYQDICDELVARERTEKRVSKYAIPFFYYILSEKYDFQEAKNNMNVYEDLKSGKRSVDKVF